MTNDDFANVARTDAVRALEAEFSTLLTHFRRLIVENANRVSPGLLPGAYKALTTIARCGKITASTLSERMLIDKGQLSRMVRELETLGLIERSPDPEDRRASLLQLTPFGVERLEFARRPQEGMLAHTLEDWSIDEIGSFTRMLHALTAQVSLHTNEAPASGETGGSGS